MSKIREMITLAILRMMLMVEEFKNEERGDTNFVSIAIVLSVVAVLAVAFVTLREPIENGIRNAIASITGALQN